MGIRGCTSLCTFPVPSTMTSQDNGHDAAFARPTTLSRFKLSLSELQAPIYLAMAPKYEPMSAAPSQHLQLNDNIHGNRRCDHHSGKNGEPRPDLIYVLHGYIYIHSPHARDLCVVFRGKYRVRDIRGVCKRVPKCYARLAVVWTALLQSSRPHDAHDREVKRGTETSTQHLQRTSRTERVTRTTGIHNEKSGREGSCMLHSTNPHADTHQVEGEEYG